MRLYSIIKILLFAGIAFSVYAKESVRIGAYDNPPKIFKDENGNIAGFWHDITMEIGKNENWEIKWVYGSWDECLRRLENNEIDIMTDTGVTPARQLKYIFSDETVYLSWNRIYKNKNSNINTILDLDGKKIGGLKNSFDLEGPEGLRKVLKDFSINADIVEMSDYESIFTAIEKNELDAGIVDKDFGILNEDKHDIFSTPILLQPAQMQFAMNKNSTVAEILKLKIDDNIRKMKSDVNSVYHTSFNSFFNNIPKKFEFPFWLRIILISAAGLLAFFSVTYFFLKKEIKKKTEHLVDQIIAREKTESELKESELKFRRLIEFAADGILLGSNEGRITEANEAACEMFGLERNEMIGKYISEMPFTEKSLKASPMRFDLLKQGLSVVSEREIIRKDGSEIQIEMKTKMMADGTYQSIYRDITSKKKAEAELKQREENYRLLVENQNDLIVKVNKDNKFVYVSPSYCKMFGKTENELIGNMFIPLIHKEDVNKTLEEMKKLNYEPYTCYVEQRAMTAQGWKWLGWSDRAVLDKNGNLEYVIGVGRDISDRIQAEHEIINLNETLEHSVKDRTRELELSNKELEAFSYSVSHDLRAPLRHILGFADIIKKQCSGGHADPEEYINKIVESTGEMGTLIDNLLNYSRTGRSEMKKNKVDLNEIVKKIQTTYIYENTGRNISWKISKLPEVECDEGLLRTVWINLIDNAVKYTSKTDTSEIEIGYSEKTDMYEFYIKDNGAGFDMTYSDKLFGVFQRLHSKNEFKGTGIGLANVERIITRHRGSVRAEGETGKGATFYFTLPKGD